MCYATKPLYILTEARMGAWPCWLSRPSAVRL